MGNPFVDDLRTAASDVLSCPSKASHRKSNRGDLDQDMLELIAVIGLSLKFPDDATSAESFWDMLMNGRCASRDFPRDRANIEGFYDPEMGRPGSLPLRGGHFLRDDIAAFDAPFFSITPSEAKAMDPMQRGLLETAYKAFENDMTIALSQLGFLSHDSRCYSFDHRANGYARGEGFGAVILKRVADAIKDGDTIRAVIRSTGSNQDGYTPGITLPDKDSQASLIRETYKKAGSDMRSTHFFEAHGTGTPIGDPIKANAVGSVFKHERDGSPPLQIGAVKGNIGHLEGAAGIAGLIKTILILEKGIIPPNTNFERTNSHIDADFLNIQFPLSSTAWPRSGLRRASINSFGFGGTNSHAVVDDAYGYLSLRNLQGNHCTLRILDQSKDADKVVEKDSLFLTNGYCHHESSVSDLHKIEVTPKIFVWSAADEAGLSRLSEEYCRYFKTVSVGCDQSVQYLGNLAYTLNVRRTSLPWKSFVVAGSVAQLQNMSLSKPVQSAKKPKLGFVFTGQGAQWSAMGRELLVYPAFAKCLSNAQEYFRKLGSSWDLLVALMTPACTTYIDDPALSQPLCTALQIGIIDLFRSFGIHASGVIGHSSGEIAAAYCTGAISRESAWKIAYFRGILSSKLAKTSKLQHAMLSVGLSEEDISPFFKEVASVFGTPELTVSCINSLRNLTVSGYEQHIDLLKQLLDADGVFARKLNVSLAYHSLQMNNIATDYLACLQDLEKGVIEGDIKFISSVTGQVTAAEELRKGDYWVQNMVKPVRFSAAMQKLCSESAQVEKKIDLSHRRLNVIHDLIEIGPHSTLKGPIRENLQSLTRTTAISYTSALIRNRSALESVLEAVGRLYCLGHTARLESVNCIHEVSPDPPHVLSNLPGYSFNHSQSYWCESRLSKNYRLRKQPRADLLGTQVPDWNPLEARWRNILKVSEAPWITEHQVNGAVIFPAAGMLVMAIEAARQMSDGHSIIEYEIKDATFQAPINLSLNPDGLETHFCLRPLRDGLDKDNPCKEFRLYVLENGQWTETCKGTTQVQYEVNLTTEVDGGLEVEMTLGKFRDLHTKAASSCTKVADPRYVYHRLKEIGLGYGPAFQPLKDLRYNDFNEATAELLLFHEKAHQNTVIHATTLDGMFQLPFVSLTKGGTDPIPTTVATRINRLWVSSTGLSMPDTDSVLAHSKATSKGRRTVQTSLSAVSKGDHQLKLVIDGFEMFYNVEWKPDPDLLDHQQIIEYCETGRDTRPEPEDCLQDLAFLVFAYVSTVHEELGQVCPSVPYLHNYVKWMEARLDEFRSGLLLEKRPQWESLRKDVTYMSSLSKRLEAESKQGKFFVRVGENLKNILLGKVDPLDLLFRDGLVKDFYEDLNQSANCFGPFIKYLDTLAHKNPAMKILEVGGGTGATTEILLNTLNPQVEQGRGTPRYAHFDFTDISVSFFENAQETFRDHPKMKFSTLDIENDSAKQHFKADSYDLIVAANVIHATRDLEVTLRNLRKLLKAGGKLVLIEVVRPKILRAGFAFGLLPGWWRSTEDYRSQSPCITEDRWDAVLTQIGYSGVDLEFRDYNSDVCHCFSILVTTTITDLRIPPVVTPKLIIVEPLGSQRHALARGLQDHLEKTECQSCGIVSLQEAASLLTSSPEQSCILLEDGFYSYTRNFDSKTLGELKTVLSRSRSVLWVTDGGQQPMTPDFGMVQGLTRVLRTENTKLIIATLALENQDCSINRRIQSISKILHSMMFDSRDRSHEPEYIEKDGMSHISRLIEAHYLNKSVWLKTSPHQQHVKKFKDGPPLKLDIRTPGLLDTFHFLEDKVFAEPLELGEIEVEVKAVGLNFLDCLAALGRVNMTALGGECAGIVTRVGDCCELRPGDRVSLCSLNIFGTYARGMDHGAIKIPDHISYTEAAAVPVTFTTAYYALHEVARARKGESILIHAGAGGTGQAAIQIAQSIGLEIFATVRDLSFAEGIKRLTKNRGVDIVLNSLAGTGLVASWECVAPYGRFIEIGKKDIYSHGKLPMFQFAANVSFSAIDLAFDPKKSPPAIIRRSFETIMGLLSGRRISAPYPLSVYGLSDLEKAFRSLQSGKNSGKIVVEFDKETIVPMTLEPKQLRLFEATATYLISGGLGGLGRSIARWMVSRGAKNLILLSRSGPVGDAARVLVIELSLKGVRVECPSCDIADLESLKEVVIRLQQSMPPIRGCIQGSMVLKDATFETMTADDWNAAIRPKVQGSWNLHTVLPKGLNFFILLSSACGVFGNGGQANYAAGNAYQDALARYRVSLGEKAAALDIAALLAEGFLAENDSSLKRSIRTGILPPISQPELLALLDHYCDPISTSSTDPLQCQAMVGIETPANIQAQGTDEPYWMRQPLFTHLYQISSSSAFAARSLTQTTDFETLFGAAASLAEAGAIVSKALLTKLSKLLGVVEDTIDGGKPLGSYGVDSLVAVELRNWFARAVGADLAIFEILGEPSITAIRINVARKSQWRQVGWGE
ncbi:hypothetical protein MMC17_007710 [Xylographa soralifera]|nr:hypothetical protein [Xylographa soralifera]